MNRSIIWILCFLALGLLCSGWSMWKLQSAVHLEWIYQSPPPANTSSLELEKPNDGSSYSFQLAREKSLRQQQSSGPVLPNP